MKPTALRQSSIKAWLDCPARYYASYVLGLDTGSGDPNLTFGTHFHAEVENYHLGKPYDKELLAGYTAQYPIVPGEQVERAFHVMLKHPKTGEELAVPFTGIVDRLTTTEIIDYKTSSVSWSQNRADADVQATAYLYWYWQTYGALLPFRFIVYRKDKPHWDAERRVQSITTARIVEDFTAFWLMCNKIIKDIEREERWPCYCRNHEHDWVSAPGVAQERIYQ